MRPRSVRLPVLVLALLAAAPLTAQRAGHTAAFDSAYLAWDAGHYDDALARLDRILAGPAAADLLADIAVLTGERYHTIEVAPDGMNPRWSADGRHALYDTPGAGAPGDAERRTVLVRVEDGRVRPVAELAGHGAVFSPDGARVAWLRLTDPAALAREQARLRLHIPARDRESWTRQREALADARARLSRVRVRDLATGEERDVPASEPVHAIVWSGGEAVPWVRSADVQMAPGGGHIVFPVDEGLAVLTVATSRQRTIARSTSPAFSADGSALAFISRDDGDDPSAPGVYRLQYLRLTGPGADNRFPETLLSSSDAIAGPALSPDGRVVAFQRMGRENWEVWVAPEGGEPRRLTHDVQHDLYPRFLAGNRLLVIKGEGRHRRSYVYPVRAGGDPEVREWVPGSGEGMRLFHNNTVRTVAPEYEWAVSPDGTMVLTVSERDGDTISPERGVYLTDLGRPVTLPELRARVRDQLAAERALRAKADRLFAGIEDDVRAALADVSVSRIQRYAADLERFGTKFIGNRGNHEAIDYIAARLREWGYDPELQWFEPRPGVRSANVIARLPGTERPDVTYVVGSHFDSVERGPGADDNSSGTTALLEAARVLATRPQPATIEFVWFTGEEAGLLGSREYARRALESGKDVAAALNNDMVGYANDDRLDNTIRYSSADVRDLQHAAALLFTDLILYDAHYYKSTDAHALYDAFGDVIGGIGSYPILANPHYHQEHDVLETIDQRLVAEVARATVGAVLGLAGGAIPDRD